MNKNMGIVTNQVEHDGDDSDTASCGTCESSCILQNLDECDSSYCSADYRALDD